MSSPCVDAFQDAMYNTSRVLFKPFEFKKWCKLTLVYLFAGGSGGGGGCGGANTPGGSSGGHHSSNSFTDIGQSFHNFLNNINNLKNQASGGFGSHEALTVIMLIILIPLFVVFILTLMYVVSVFHFIFIECIVRNQVKVIEYFQKHTRYGLSYFLWNIVFSILFVLTVAITIVLPIAALYPLMKGGPISLLVIAAIFWILMLVAIFAVLISISVLTRDLVLPLMMKNNISIIPAWRLLYPRLSSNILQALLFLLIKMGFGVAVAIISFFALLVSLIACGIAFGIPAALVFGLAYVLKATASPVLMFIGIIWLVIAIIALIFIIAAIMLPTGVFERSYNVSFLGRLEPEFSLFAQYGRSEQAEPLYSPVPYS